MPKNPEAVKLGALGGKARAKKYTKAELSAMGKLGGRPLTFKADCGHLVNKKDFYKHTYHGATACKACAEKIGV